MTFDDLYQQQKLNREKVFRDPVHDYIYVHDRIILELIDTIEFQRLRRIKQLGTTNYTFHGADHTRFAHCIGVYELTRRIINNFSRNYPTKQKGDGLWDDSERLVALCAGLLHDVGHGAFSHTFERLFSTNHEAITQKIITSSETEINQVLRQMGEDFPEKVASVIAKTYPNQQVVQLISSQLDADRMDYLLRDAYYTGVTYGKFDLTRILRVIRPYEGRILFDYSGMHAIEDYIVSRYQMYMQIYFHPTSRAMEELLHNTLRRAHYCYHHLNQTDTFKGSFLEPFLKGNWTLQDYLNIDDHTMNTSFTHWLTHEDDMLRDLAYRILSRKPPESIVTTLNQVDELTYSIQQELSRFGFDPEYYFSQNNCSDLPYDFYRTDGSSQRTQIDLITKTNQIVELSKVSPIVHALAGNERGDLRLYFPQELLTHIYGIDENDRNPNQELILNAHIKETHDVTHLIQERLF